MSLHYSKTQQRWQTVSKKPVKESDWALLRACERSSDSPCKRLKGGKEQCVVDDVSSLNWIDDLLATAEGGATDSTAHKDGKNSESPSALAVAAAAAAAAPNLTGEDMHLKKLAIAATRTQPLTMEEIRTIYEAPQRSPLWFESRYGRLSGSLFGTFNKHVRSNEDAWLAKFLWNPEADTAPKAAACVWGTEKEANAFSDYWRFMILHEGPKLQAQGLPPYVYLEQVGFIVSHKKPWRGVSPDGILHTPYWKDSARTQVGWRRSLIEIKCPFSLREARGENRFYDNQIKDEYYDQIQGIMGQLNLPFCDFIMWTPSGFRIVRFPFNEKYYRELDANIDRFYFQKMLPAIEHRLAGRLLFNQIRPIPPVDMEISDSDAENITEP